MSAVDVAYVTLALVPGIGRARLSHLLAHFHSADAVLDASVDQLAAVRGMSRAAATAVANASRETGTRAIARAEEIGGRVLVPDSPDFPGSLRTIPESPTLLFVQGDVRLLHAEAVAIVGSRHHSRYGAEAARHFAAGLARAGLVVVSGMARGLDAVAHHATLDAGGGTVGVLGNGLGVVYPAANRALYDRVREFGCLITEFPPGERPSAGSFPRRNRLISGLARATLVIEAREKSGALITVDCALAQGREVLAVPGAITSPTSVGCNRLIQQGAKPALAVDDVLEEYGIVAAPVGDSQAELGERDRMVLAALDRGLQSPDEVAVALEWSVAEALSALTDLELRGIVACEPGGTFRRTVGSVAVGS
ncbi:MAG: DNA-protecting protein DprA [Gemmatimonadales bacterium]|nr:DNA-protecting protein DprA [Gemmatimonadales bacterium]